MDFNNFEIFMGFNMFLSTILCYRTKVKGERFSIRERDVLCLALDWWRFYELRILFSLAVDTRALEDLCNLHSLLCCETSKTV
jgi:hypothetical protein